MFPANGAREPLGEFYCEFRRFRKRGQNECLRRSAAGNQGNQNAVTHGRHCAPVRAARRAAALALHEKRKRKSDQWVKLCPPTDYGAIVDGIREMGGVGKQPGHIFRN